MTQIAIFLDDLKEVQESPNPMKSLKELIDYWETELEVQEEIYAPKEESEQS